jgi:hypothetical protein
VKGDVEVILGKMPPPGKTPPKPMDKGGDKGDGGDDYDAALDSMGAFIDAVKSGDAQAALDAWGDVKSNC